MTSPQSYYVPAAGWTPPFSPRSTYWLGWLIFLRVSLPCSGFWLPCLTVASVTPGHYVHSHTVSQRRGPFRCFNEPSAESLSAAGPAKRRRREPGTFVQIKAKQFVRINGFIFFDTIVADKRSSLALGKFCCWAIRTALRGAAEGVSQARRPDGLRQSLGVCVSKAGVWRTDWPGFANHVKPSLLCKEPSQN